MSEERLTEEEMKNIMDFDPFAGGGEGGESEAGGDGPADDAPPPAEAPTGAAEPAEVPSGEAEVHAPAAPPSEPPAAAAPTSPAQGGTVEVGILQRLVQDQARSIDRLTAQLEEMRKAPPAAQGGRQVNTPAGNSNPSVGSSEGGLPSYEFDVPDQLVDAMASEDPRERKMALRALIKGTATAIHSEMMKSIEPRFSEIPQKLQSEMAARQEAARRQEEVQKDFYGAFPDLQHEALRPFISNVSQTVMRETGLSEWSPQLRDAIGNRARMILGRGAPAPAVPSPAVRPAVPAPPPAMHGTATRPATTASRPVDEVWELINSR